MLLSRFLVVGVIASVTGSVACTAWSDTYINSRENAAAAGDEGDGGASSTTSASTSNTSSSCSGGSFVKADVSKLTACSGANGSKGHCYAKGQVPIASQLAACNDASQVCVPDEILTAGGSKLTSCKSIVGPGACVTGMLFPQLVAQGGSALGKDVCSEGELCLPCTDPRNGSSTGMCDPTGVLAEGSSCNAPATSASDAGAPAPLPKCCTSQGHSNGVCLAETAIPADQRDQTKADTCSSGNKCVPAAFVSGTPTKCDGLLGQGVCMDQCFDDMLGFAGMIGILSNKGCATSTEFCIPCSFLSGKGVPGCK